MSERHSSSGMDSSSAFHGAYVFLNGLLLTSIGIESTGSGTNFFKEQSALTMLFLLAEFVYVIALLIPTLRADGIHRWPPRSMLHYLSHASGAAACELLLLILVSPIKWLIINVSSVLVLLASCSCYHYRHHLYTLICSKCFGQTPYQEIDIPKEATSTTSADQQV